MAQLNLIIEIDYPIIPNMLDREYRDYGCFVQAQAFDAKLGIAKIGDFEKFGSYKGFKIKKYIRDIYRSNFAVASGKCLNYIRITQPDDLASQVITDESEAHDYIISKLRKIQSLLESVDFDRRVYIGLNQALNLSREDAFVEKLNQAREDALMEKLDQDKEDTIFEN